MKEGQTYHAPVNGPARDLVWVVATGAALVAAAVTWWRPFRVAVAGHSMRPALEPGDWLVATGRGPVRPGRVVILAHPSRPGMELVKRVVAVAGETSPEGGILGVGQVWVEGDHHVHSSDSRSFGPVPRSAIAGVVRVRYAPVSRIGPVGVRQSS
jgi:signal peptidase I